MKCVFGPVPTRRLGRSLGIDTVPLKTCNWNCVYCQLGRSHPVIHERREYVPVDVILTQVREALGRLSHDEIDWVTFVASGEGTLHTGMGVLISTVRSLTDRPIAVITNGSTLSLAEVRASLAQADAVLPTLDAGNAILFRRINRPHPSLTFEAHVAGLKAFALMTRRARLWIEVMLVADLNDGDQELRELANLLEDIGPEEIHLTLPTRGPAEEWVRTPSPDRVARALAILGPRANLADTTSTELVLRSDAPVEEQITEITCRHPLRLADLQAAARRAAIGDLDDILQSLIASGRIAMVFHAGQTLIRGLPTATSAQGNPPQ